MKKVLVLIAWTSVAALASGGEGGGHHSPLELFWKGFNILLFLGIVYWFGRKPIAEAFNGFWKSLTKGVDESEQELEKAREELEKAREELEKAKVRADESIALARESAQTEVENTKKHAEEVAQRVKEKARETVEIELKKAKEELAMFGMAKAEEVAKGMLEEAFKDPEVQRRYIEAQLKVLEDKRNA
ncbi:ATP synthase F0 subunit B [Hydrogenivirga sp.]